MNQGVRLAIQVLITAGTTGLIYLLLTLRPQRRRINAGATSEEATAASTLSGAALVMVQNADDRATRAEKAADKARRDLAATELRADQLERDLRRSEAEREEQIRALNERVDELEDEVSNLLGRERDLEQAMTVQGVTPPPRRRGYDVRPDQGPVEPD